MLYFFERIIALVILIFLIPFFAILFPIIKLSSPGPFIFTQKRIGKNKSTFTIYKFRSMDKDAESRKNIYKTLNELDGPLFKISKDPRLTWIGKLLVKNGLDELPQLLNIAKGEMSFVGPRPFPIDEAKMIEKKYDKRYSVMPGLTGTWVLKGFHKLSFKKWMELDLEYVNSKNIWYDVVVIIRTIRLLLKM